MFRPNSDEVLSPEESYEHIIEMVDGSEMPSWITDEMEKLWENPDDFEAGETLDRELMNDPLYLLFRLGIGFGIEYERKYPTDGNWRENDDG